MQKIIVSHIPTRYHGIDIQREIDLTASEPFVNHFLVESYNGANVCTGHRLPTSTEIENFKKEVTK